MGGGNHPGAAGSGSVGRRKRQDGVARLAGRGVRRGWTDDKGLVTIAEALRLADKNDERLYEAEVYRIKGELTLAQSSLQRLASSVTEAEECFLKAIEIAQRQ